jgi:hypothetical protein
VRNSWDPRNPYRGVNTVLEGPKQGGFMGFGGTRSRMELQFHTTESFHAKQHGTHKLYEEMRAIGTSPEKKAALLDDMKVGSNPTAASAMLTPPERASTPKMYPPRWAPLI